jgi:hypothetical protein
MRGFKHMLSLLVAPERFIGASTDRIVALQKRHHEGPYTEEHRARAEAFARFQAITLRRAIFVSIATTALTILFGYLAGRGLRVVIDPAKFLVYLMQAVGAAVILGATLAQIGRKHESMGGETLADEMNSNIFRVLYVIGTFVFVLSASWDA